MKTITLKYVLIILSIAFASCNTDKHKNQQSEKDIYSISHQLITINSPKHAPQPGEWLATYAEQYQSYGAYTTGNPTRATPQRSKLYILQIGPFDKKGTDIYNRAKEYLKIFFHIEVRDIGMIPTTTIPARHTRNNTFGLQLKSIYIIDSILQQKLPEDAFAIIAFTRADLYPDDTWNFVFGQASLNKRAGVWSLARLGDYSLNDSMFQLCLRRTLDIAIHETGHMFGISHCTQYECCMNGSNSLEEADKEPSWFCWECMAKICWNRNMEPEKQTRALLQFHHKYNVDRSSLTYYRKAIKILGE